MKLNNLHWLLTFMAGASAALMCARCNNGASDGRYIVTDKVDKKVAYHNLSQPYDMHVMTFEKESGYYPHINVGDTIVGPARFMNKPVVNSKREKVVFLTRYDVDVINSVNGKKLDELQEIAQRDMMLRNMKTRQK